MAQQDAFFAFVAAEQLVGANGDGCADGGVGEVFLGCLSAVASVGFDGLDELVGGKHACAGESKGLPIEKSEFRWTSSGVIRALTYIKTRRAAHVWKVSVAGF